MLKKALSVLFIIPLLIVAALAAPAHAASFNITTSPLPVLLATKPGVPVSTTLRVQNSGTETTRFNVSLKKFRANGATGKPLLQNRGPNDEYFDWVSFS
jgi:hypothetical protein